MGGKVSPEYFKEWRKKNPNYMKEWIKNNPDYFKTWDRNNREKRIESEKKYINKNRQKIRNKNNRLSILYRQAGLVDESIKLKIFASQRWKCVICKDKESLTIDHIIPISKGGKSDYDNLQGLCRSCNSSKGNKILTSFDIRFIKNLKHTILPTKKARVASKAKKAPMKKVAPAKKAMPKKMVKKGKK